MKPSSYEEAGVSVARGDAFAASIASRTSPAVAALGGFAGAMQLDAQKWVHPVLLSTTDGVGTKLLLAREFDQYQTIGIDLVAMCVNDLAVCGAQPLQFLDYIACGRINQERLARVLDGIIAGCELAGATLAGGETAEMPGMYGEDELDLAGFAVGMVEREEHLPRVEDVAAGDVLLGLPSSGVHSNGLSLARKVLHRESDRRLLLEPTRVYVEQLMRVRHSIKGAAHITGGGLLANLGRILPAEARTRISWEWPVPQVFDVLQSAGGLAADEMRLAFNMGVGIVMVVAPEKRTLVEQRAGEPLIEVGIIEAIGG